MIYLTLYLKKTSLKYTSFIAIENGVIYITSEEKFKYSFCRRPRRRQKLYLKVIRRRSAANYL
jgi:hypothetical protein